MTRLIFKEVTQDIFTMGKNYYLAHCISADYALGAGIALEFERRFHIKKELIYDEECNEIEYFREYPDCILTGRIFNLVTKINYYDKPTYSDLRKALEIMKDLVISHSIQKIAMPTIGCGLDRLDWNKVKLIIREVFDKVSCEIIVCKYKP